MSYSRVNRDCSWHHACAGDSLNDHGVGGPTYKTVRVRDVSMALAATARCPRAAGRPGIGRALLDGEEAERPTRRGRAETVHVVTFYSEGPPHDRGKPLSAHAGVLEAAFAPHVGSFRAYSAREVRTLRLRTGESGADVLAESSHPAVKNPGLAALGHMAVKPFLLLHRLEALAPGEWLIFLDVNVLQHALAGWSRRATECTWLPLNAAECSPHQVLKHPELLSGARRLSETTEWLWNRTRPSADVFMPHEAPGKLVKHFCKTHAVCTASDRASLIASGCT